jgi:hypothetical protein
MRYRPKVSCTPPARRLPWLPVGCTLEGPARESPAVGWSPASGLASTTAGIRALAGRASDPRPPHRPLPASTSTTGFQQLACVLTYAWRVSRCENNIHTASGPTRPAPLHSRPASDRPRPSLRSSSNLAPASTEPQTQSRIPWVRDAESTSLHEKHNLGIYGWRRPGETATSTVVPRRLLTLKRSHWADLDRCVRVASEASRNDGGLRGSGQRLRECL